MLSPDILYPSSQLSVIFVPGLTGNIVPVSILLQLSFKPTQDSEKKNEVFVSSACIDDDCDLSLDRLIFKHYQ